MVEAPERIGHTIPHPGSLGASVSLPRSSANRKVRHPAGVAHSRIASILLVG